MTRRRDNLAGLFTPVSLLFVALTSAACQGSGDSTATADMLSTGATTGDGGTSEGPVTAADSTGVTTGAASTTDATGALDSSGTTMNSGGDESSTGTAVDPCAENFLTWENFGEPFMLTWCTGCHHTSIPTAERADAPCGVNLDRHADVYTWRERILARAVLMRPTPMPPAAILAADDLALLKQYIECGAPGPEVGGALSMCPDPP